MSLKTKKDFLEKLDTITKENLKEYFQKGGTTLANDFDRKKLALLMLDELNAILSLKEVKVNYNVNPKVKR